MRILVQFVLPLLLPGLLFLLWAYMTRVRPGEHGPARDIFAQGPWFRLIVAGFVLMTMGLATVAFLDGTEPDGTYRAPYLQDGKIVPGGMVKKP